MPKCRIGQSVGWRYRGDWFDFEATLDQQATRLCAVRVEQVIRAYRHLLPPLRPPRSRLRVIVTGSFAEYRELLATQDVNTTSPAAYLPRQNWILVGTELAPSAAQWQQVEARARKTAGREPAVGEPDSPRDSASWPARLRKLGRTAE